MIAAGTPGAWTAGGVLLLGAASLEGALTALQVITEGERRRLAERGGLLGRAATRLLDARTSVETSLRLASLLAQVGAAAAVALLLAPTLVPPWVGVVFVAPATLLVTCVTARALGARLSRPWLLLSAPPVLALHALVTPLRIGLDLLLAAASRRLGGAPPEPADEEPRNENEEAFLAIVDRGAELGALAEEERELIEAVFELDDVPVARVMTPAPDIFSLPLDVGWDGLLEACREARWSRVPIWEGSPDNIIGVLLVKDLLRHRRRPLASPAQLRRLLLPPVYAPASRPVGEMMKEMIRRRIHMAFVVDEHGVVIGLVTLDDLITELVGELRDEDTDEPQGDIVETAGDALTVRAAVDLDDFAEETGIRVPEGDYHTLGGFVFHTLGRVPETGDVVCVNGHRIEVVEMEGRRVTLLRVAPTDDATEATR